MEEAAETIGKPAPTEGRSLTVFLVVAEVRAQALKEFFNAGGQRRGGLRLLIAAVLVVVHLLDAGERVTAGDLPVIGSELVVLLLTAFGLGDVVGQVVHAAEQVHHAGRALVIVVQIEVLGQVDDEGAGLDSRSQRRFG